MTAELPSAAQLAAKSIADRARLMSDDRPGWVTAAGGVTELVTGAPLAQFNNVWVTDAGADRARIAAAIDHVATAGLPFSVIATDAADEVTVEVARGRGLVDDQPTVVIGASATREEPVVDGFAIARFGADGVADHQRVLVEAFGMPEALAAVFGGAALFEDPSVRGYLGRVGGQTTSTAMTILDGELASLYSVATVPARRRSGQGAAVTIRACVDAFAAGARWIIGSSSEMAEPLYEMLGRRELARWPTWTGA